MRARKTAYSQTSPQVSGLSPVKSRSVSQLRTGDVRKGEKVELVVSQVPLQYSLWFIKCRQGASANTRATDRTLPCFTSTFSAM